MSKDKSDQEKNKKEQKKKKMKKKKKKEKNARDRQKKMKKSKESDLMILQKKEEQLVDLKETTETRLKSNDEMRDIDQAPGEAQEPLSRRAAESGPTVSRPSDEDPAEAGSQDPGRITFFRTFDDEIVRIDRSQVEAESAPQWVGPRHSTEPIPVIPGYYTLADAFENFRRRQEILDTTGQTDAMIPPDLDRPVPEGSGRKKGGGKKSGKHLKKTAKKNGDPSFSLDELMEGLSFVSSGPVLAQEELNQKRQDFDANIDDAIRTVLRQIREAEESGEGADRFQERILV